MLVDVSVFGLLGFVSPICGGLVWTGVLRCEFAFCVFDTAKALGLVCVPFVCYDF